MNIGGINLTEKVVYDASEVINPPQNMDTTPSNTVEFASDEWLMRQIFHNYLSKDEFQMSPFSKEFQGMRFIQELCEDNSIIDYNKFSNDIQISIRNSDVEKYTLWNAVLTKVYRLMFFRLPFIYMFVSVTRANRVFSVLGNVIEAFNVHIINDVISQPQFAIYMCNCPEYMNMIFSKIYI